MNRYRVYANICEGDDIYRYRTFVVHADSPQAVRAMFSNDWNIDGIRKMARKDIA